MARYLLILVKLLSLVTALPTLHSLPGTQRDDSAIPAITEAMIKSIAPTSATCDAARSPAQCMTAKTMASLDLIGIAAKWGLTTKGEMAAGLASMAIDSGEFKTDDTVGQLMVYQGTYSMLVGNDIIWYADAIANTDAGFKLMFETIIPPGNITEYLKKDDRSYEKTLEAVTTLLTTDLSRNVGSTFWRISQINVPEVREGLKKGTGWNDFITTENGSKRFQSQMTPEIQGYWDRACKALGGCSLLQNSRSLPSQIYGGL